MAVTFLNKQIQVKRGCVLTFVLFMFRYFDIKSKFCYKVIYVHIQLKRHKEIKTNAVTVFLRLKTFENDIVVFNS